GEEIALAGREDDGLFPLRPGPLARCRELIREVLLDCDEVHAGDDDRGQLLRLRADLRPLVAPLRPLAAIAAVEGTTQDARGAAGRLPTSANRASEVRVMDELPDGMQSEPEA